MKYVLYIILKVEIKKIILLILFILIRELENRIVRTNKYIILIIYIDEVFNNIFKIVYFIIEIYLVKNLKVNIFINNDILVL